MKFTPEDFRDIEKRMFPGSSAAQIANAKLKEWLNSEIDFAGFIGMGKIHGGITSSKYNLKDHRPIKAKLVCIEEM